MMVERVRSITIHAEVDTNKQTREFDADVDSLREAVDMLAEWGDVHADAVEELGSLDGADQEVAHGRADEILLSCVPEDVADAYRAARDRIGFWYA